MSLDISLEIRESVYDANITHNLTQMADAAQLFYVLWRPEEIGVSTAEEAVPFLRAGLMLLHAEPDKFKKMAPENGWGSYDGLLKATNDYLRACEKNPSATIRVSR